MSDVAGPPRQLPNLNPMNAYFWQSGRTGRLEILRCADCRTWIHPFAGACPKCRSEALKPEPVSGRGEVVSYTINHHPWLANVPVPYAVAMVTLEEQDNIRLVTNVMNCPLEDVRIGLPVEVLFEQHEDVWVPLFQPRGAAV